MIDESIYKAFRVGSFLLCVMLVGCANSGRISSKDRDAIGSIQLSTPAEPKPNLYCDSTSITAEVALMPFGMVGGFVGGCIADANAKAGVKRWKPVTQGCETQVLDAVRSHLEKEFTETGKLQFSNTPPIEAKLVVTNVAYGVAKSRHSFAASLSIRVEIKAANGKCVWKHIGSATSDTEMTLEEYKQNQGAYVAALDKAAEKLARDLAKAFSKSTSSEKAKANWWESPR